MAEDLNYYIWEDLVWLQTLTVIKPLASGYSVPFLRDASRLGQALPFIQPLQRNLDISIMNMISEFWPLFFICGHKLGSRFIRVCAQG